MRSSRARQVANTMNLAYQARTFLDDAHQHGHRGEAMLRRWAMLRNGARHVPGWFVSEKVIAAAVLLERADDDQRELSEAAAVTLDDAARSVRVAE